MSVLFLLSIVLLFVLFPVVFGVILISKKKHMHIARILFMIPILAVIFVVTCFVMLIVLFSTQHQIFYMITIVSLGVLMSAFCGCALWGLLKKKIVRNLLCLSTVACILVMVGFFSYNIHFEKTMVLRDGYNLLSDYAPNLYDSKVAKLDGVSALTIDSDFPKMDGATALYPIYSAFAKAVYPEEILESHNRMNDYLNCSTTSWAYKKIINGEADIIFAAAPSFEQEQLAINSGVELVYTPIGKEAFVFFVNSKNPIDSLTVEQIQDIYSGKITDWGKLGAERLGEIRAFQRDKGSGSQTALVHFMDGKELMIPPSEDVVGGMGGIISKTSDYKNYKNSIGYSFRFYSTEMVQNNRIKLLKINGIAPNTENIENGTYPLTDNFYAVTRSDASENTKKLLEWICGEQGQELIEKTGYTPLKK